MGPSDTLAAEMLIDGFPVGETKEASIIVQCASCLALYDILSHEECPHCGSWKVIGGEE